MGWLLDNVFLQYGGYKVIRTILGKQTIRALASLGREVLGILAKISVAIIKILSLWQVEMPSLPNCTNYSLFEISKYDVKG